MSLHSEAVARQNLVDMIAEHEGVTQNLIIRSKINNPEVKPMSESPVNDTPVRTHLDYDAQTDSDTIRRAKEVVAGNVDLPEGALKHLLTRVLDEHSDVVATYLTAIDAMGDALVIDAEDVIEAHIKKNIQSAYADSISLFPGKFKS